MTRFQLGAAVSGALLAVLAVVITDVAFIHRQRTAEEINTIVQQLGVQYPDPVSLSPDGSLLLLKSLESSTFELRVIDRATGRRVGRQIADNRQMVPEWRPGARDIAFLQDSNGNQRYRVAVWHTTTGATTYPPAPETAALTLAWAPDGTRLAYVVQSLSSGVRDLVVIGSQTNAAPAMTLVSGLATRAPVAWSPDSRTVATTVFGSEGSVVLSSIDGTHRRLHIRSDSEVRDLTWLSVCDCLIVALRVADDSHTHIVSVAPETGEIQWLHEEPGDVSALTGFGLGYAYQVTAEGRSYAVVNLRVGTGPRISLDRIDGTTLAFGLSPRGDTIFGAHLPTAAPPGLMMIPTRDLSHWLEQRWGGAPPHADYVAARSVSLRSADGTRVRAYLWSARERAIPRHALVLVHGGPTLQTKSTWDAGIQLAVSRGFDVIAVNYRGSSGYGPQYEMLSYDTDGQVDDVAAACQFAEDSLGVPAANLVVWGHSYGARLVARLGAAHPELARKLILISLLPDATTRMTAPEKQPEIVLYQGQNDVVQDPRSAEREITRIFPNGLGLAHVRERVVTNEGHSFRRLRSWARVYADALRE